MHHILPRTNHWFVEKKMTHLSWYYTLCDQQLSTILREWKFFFFIPDIYGQCIFNEYNTRRKLYKERLLSAALKWPRLKSLKRYSWMWRSFFGHTCFNESIVLSSCIFWPKKRFLGGTTHRKRKEYRVAKSDRAKRPARLLPIYMLLQIND